MLAYIRMEEELDLFSDYLFSAFSVVTLVSINCGGLLLCFRRKRYFCAFFLLEIGLLILFFCQIFILVDSSKYHVSG